MIPAHSIAQARFQFTAHVGRILQQGACELMLSGGVDSATILFAMLENGARPRCLTFQVGDTVSNDVRVASSMCKAFGLEHQVVSLPREMVRQDAERVIGMVDWRQVPRIKKTIVQCVHPFLYLLPAMNGDRALIGNSGDSYFLTDRRSQVKMHREGARSVWEWRRSHNADPHYSDYHIIDVAARHYGKQLIDVYDWPWWAWWIQQFEPDATNHPVQKYAAAAMFTDYWKRGQWYREADRFQIGSGLRSLHDTLCSGTPHKAVIGVYNEMAKQLGVPVGTGSANYDATGRIVTSSGRVYCQADSDPLAVSWS